MMEKCYVDETNGIVLELTPNSDPTALVSIVMIVETRLGLVYQV
jgi:hypothetical protein